MCGYCDRTYGQEEPEGDMEATWLELLVMWGIQRKHIEHITWNHLDSTEAEQYLDKEALKIDPPPPSKPRMVFRVGGMYEHTTGKMMKIVGKAHTTMWGNCLVGEESGSDGLAAIGRSPDNAENWKEITEEKWMSNFSK